MTLELSELKWDMRFLNIAKEIASWSKDPSTQVGACIYDGQRRPVSQGYNGLPKGMSDDARLVDREWKIRHTIHAEDNALLFANGHNLSDCTIYVYPFMPCAACASKIVQKGILRVVSFKNNIIRWASNMEEARQTFKECGVELVEYGNEELEKRG